MCGRYRLTAKERYLRDHFGIDEDFSWTPRWNIAPTQSVPIIRQEDTKPRRSFDLVRWGLIPSSSWAKDPSIATKTINAMSETAAQKPAFRGALRWRRCLIPSDGFYEWQSIGSKQKQPFSMAWPTTRRLRLRDSGNAGTIRVVNHRDVHHPHYEIERAGGRCSRSHACNPESRRS